MWDENLDVIELIMKSSAHLSTPEANVRSLIFQLQLCQNRVTKQDNDLRQTSKSAKKESWERKEYCNDIISVQTQSQIKSCDGTLRELCMNKYLKIWMNYSNLWQRIIHRTYDSFIKKAVTSHYCCWRTSDNTASEFGTLFLKIMTCYYDICFCSFFCFFFHKCTCKQSN